MGNMGVMGGGVMGGDLYECRSLLLVKAINFVGLYYLIVCLSFWLSSCAVYRSSR